MSGGSIECVLLFSNQRVSWVYKKDKYDDNNDEAWTDLTTTCKRQFGITDVDEVILINDENDIKENEGTIMEDADEFADTCIDAIDEQDTQILFLIKV